MYEINIKTHFSGAHRLIDYDGPCANLHGHNWEVEVGIKGEKLNELGFIADFGDVKKAVAETLDELDHADLNALPAFTEQNPTSENISRYLFEQISTRFNTADIAVSKVTVHETPGSSVTYTK